MIKALLMWGFFCTSKAGTYDTSVVQIRYIHAHASTRKLQLILSSKSPDTLCQVGAKSSKLNY